MLGWTCPHTSEHYVALIATWCTANNSVEEALLAMAPMDGGGRVAQNNLIDDDHEIDDLTADFTAAALKVYIDRMLAMYDKTSANIDALSGDNCRVNRKLARLMGTFLIGCANHKLALAVKRGYSEEDVILIDLVNSIMVAVKHMKNSSRLRTITDLRPVLRNATRWSSCFEMLKRFITLYEIISVPINEFEFLMRLQ